jgi:hypothetical protein
MLSTKIVDPTFPVPVPYAVLSENPRNNTYKHTTFSDSVDLSQYFAASTARPSLSHTSFTMPSTYKKEKPWDTDDIDKWKVEAFTPADNAGGTFAEESSFATRMSSTISCMTAQT